MIKVHSKYLNMFTEDQSHVLVTIIISVTDVYMASGGLVRVTHNVSVNMPSTQHLYVCQQLYSITATQNSMVMKVF